MKECRRLWAALIVLALVSPVGLYLPNIMRSGSAWGEWGMAEIRQMVGYVPAGMQNTGVWKAPISAYSLPEQEQAHRIHPGFSYALSAFVGIVACGCGGYLLSRWVTGSRKRRGT